MNETMAQSNGFIISEVDEEDKPMLMEITNNHISSGISGGGSNNGGNHHNGKQTGGKNNENNTTSSSSPGITALINRQLQGKFVKRHNYRNRKPWYLS